MLQPVKSFLLDGCDYHPIVQKNRGRVMPRRMPLYIVRPFLSSIKPKNVQVAAS